MSDGDGDGQVFPGIAYTGHPYISDSGKPATLIEEWRSTWTFVVHGTPPRLVEVEFVDVLAFGWRHSPDRCEGSICMAENDDGNDVDSVGLPGGQCATRDCCGEAVAVLPLEAADSSARSWRDIQSRCLSCLAHFHRIVTPIYREPDGSWSDHFEFGRQFQRYLMLPCVMVAATHCDDCGEELNVANPATAISGGNTTPGAGVSIVCRNHITATASGDQPPE